MESVQYIAETRTKEWIFSRFYYYGWRIQQHSQFNLLLTVHELQVCVIHEPFILDNVLEFVHGAESIRSQRRRDFSPRYYSGWRILVLLLFYSITYISRTVSLLKVFTNKGRKVLTESTTIQLTGRKSLRVKLNSRKSSRLQRTLVRQTEEVESPEERGFT